MLAHACGLAAHEVSNGMQCPGPSTVAVLQTQPDSTGHPGLQVWAQLPLTRQASWDGEQPTHGGAVVVVVVVVATVPGAVQSWGGRQRELPLG